MSSRCTWARSLWVLDAHSTAAERVPPQRLPLLLRHLSRRLRLVFTPPILQTLLWHLYLSLILPRLRRLLVPRPVLLL